jgi:pyruvate kinase
MALIYPPRNRRVRIVATLGPASRDKDKIAALVKAGADCFRINMSHGTQADRAEIIGHIRAVEEETHRPIPILVDLQGPKLRVGAFKDSSVMLSAGQTFQFDLDQTLGDNTRVHLPHRELFAAMRIGATLLVDDGKLRFTVLEASAEKLVTRAELSGKISNHKGVNVPDVVVPLAALTEKDRSDLAFALDQGADWIALSFVQRPEDVAEARKLIGTRAGLLAKIEKPSAVEFLDDILELADAVMVARGDLGVELPPEAVPPIQKRIVAAARRAGKPVVVATQMLESMITAPTPTRAEVSDVANAVYDGADAVMLSAESAAGSYPVEAVAMMNRIADTIEHDPGYGAQMDYAATRPEPTAQDAVSAASSSVAKVLGAKAIVCFTSSGSTARRIGRERPSAPVLVLTPRGDTARRLGINWGLTPVRTRDVESLEEMIDKAKRMALRTKLAQGGDPIVVIAGYPFGTPGSTNLLHISWLRGDELSRHKR